MANRSHVNTQRSQKEGNMSKRISIASGALVALAAVFALLLAVAVPALAHHKEDHSQGNAASQEDSAENDKGNSGKDNDGDADDDPNTAYTEDDDTNDGGTPNNVPDDGDNAHPSGKDRSVENGGSGNQGKSESDPDDDGRGPDRSNGGPDKPNGSGGVDKADQDGNNGCGNDDDFEDDNEGWCGRKPKPAKPAPVAPCDKDATMPGTQPCTTVEAPDVKPNVVTRPGRPKTPAVVLGERLERGDEPGSTVAARGPETQPLGGVLPFTGASILVYLGAGLALTGTGIIAARRR
jgi:hypothetical protein